GEGPWWHPWLCGGVPAWGNVEAASNLVSVYLPVYLLADIRSAIRIEVLGGAVTGLVGTFLLARRFTRSVALSSLVAILYMFNGRWAMQAAVGHTWHLQYGLLPWAFFFFDRSQDRDRLHNALFSAGVLALMAYWGAIYPLPQTAVFLCCYALLLALFRLSLKPIAALGLTGIFAIGLSSLKLFAILDGLKQIPRLIESRETIGLAELLVMLGDPNQRYGTRPVPVPAYNWHEWGLYVGVGGILCLALAVVFASGVREHAFKIMGLVCLLLGFGAFNPAAPWALLHKLPVFASQHVPSRYHYPMILFLSLSFAGWAGRWVEETSRRLVWLDLALLVPVAAIAADIARVSRIPFEQAFWMEKPDTILATEVFEHRTHAPVSYVRPDWAAPILLSMMANVGVIDCYGVDPHFRPGAVAADSPNYRGRAHIEGSAGEANVTTWTPNRAVVEYRGAEPGALLVYNMNYDPSWRAGGEPAINYRGRVAARLEKPADTMEFRYFPRSFRWSIPVFLATALSLTSWSVFRRRRLRAAQGGDS
ncbi:MAG TPA: hypothetical protein VGJ84_08020, partial [Polyangiaceae bacterium]